MTSLRRILVFANGEYPPAPIVRRVWKEADAALAVDGGAREAKRFGIVPRWILGDLDSYGPEGGRPGTLWVYEPDPDRSDLEKAFDFLRRRLRPLQVWVLGALGRRTDHSLGNLKAAENFKGSFEISFWARDGELRLVGKRWRFRSKKKRGVALISGPEKSQVSLSGVLYPLRRQWLPAGSRGVSNLANAKTVSLQVHRGWVWAFRQY
ncbi:MAG: thiamine diphosphokinase [Elusimicrobia bacterium]|nr:thiamine diphosphokinase [Elusimicrobiota bacterium]